MSAYLGTSVYLQVCFIRSGPCKIPVTATPGAEHLACSLASVSLPVSDFGGTHQWLGPRPPLAPVADPVEQGHLQLLSGSCPWPSVLPAHPRLSGLDAESLQHPPHAGWRVRLHRCLRKALTRQDRLVLSFTRIWPLSHSFLFSPPPCSSPVPFPCTFPPRLAGFHPPCSNVLRLQAFKLPVCL